MCPITHPKYLLVFSLITNFRSQYPKTASWYRGLSIRGNQVIPFNTVMSLFCPGHIFLFQLLTCKWAWSYHPPLRKLDRSPEILREKVSLGCRKTLGKEDGDQRLAIGAFLTVAGEVGCWVISSNFYKRKVLLVLPSVEVWLKNINLFFVTLRAAVPKKLYYADQSTLKLHFFLL